MVRTSGNRNGWTFVELMIAAAIIGLLASLTPTIINQTVKFFILSKTKLELQEQARAVMYLLTRELRQAQSNTIVIDQVANQPYYSRIAFTKIGGTQKMTYSQNGTNLTVATLNIPANRTDTTTLSKNLAYMAFTFPKSDDMTIVSVSLTLQEQIYNGQFKALHMASERVRVMN